MSIEMEKPATLVEKLDTLTNLIEQMFIAHQVGNEALFRESHAKAARLGFEAMQLAEAKKSKRQAQEAPPKEEDIPQPSE